MRILAPAKINLFLEVRNKRPDGYHNIESIMQTISLYDELEIKPASSRITLNCSIPTLPTDERNLVARAAQILKRELKTTFGARIFLRKRIPIGAGLGGGSSDAAATLKGLLRLWKKRISRKKLLKIASKIGADVPFFIQGGTAVARGIGDVLKPLKNVKKCYFVVVFPGFQVRTSDVYRGLNFPLTKRRKINRIKALLESSKGYDDWNQYLYNRLEDVVVPRHEAISRIKEEMTSRGLMSLMSGSGSAVFGIVSSRKEGENIKKRLSKRWKVWVAESLISA